MSDDRHEAMTRRTALRRFAALAGAAAVPAIGLPSQQARAAEYGTVAKAAVNYQDHPNGKAYCAHCINLIPGKSADAMGHCRIVTGQISPHGWCLAFAAG